MREPNVVIVGAGPAGHALARALRRRDPACAITMIAAHDAAVYPKAALAHAIGLGRDAASLVQASADMVAAREKLHLLANGRVLAIDLQDGSVSLRHARIPYHRLVLALGEEIPLPEGLEAPPGAVSAINRLAEYAALRSRLVGAEHVVVLGSSAAACEFANDLVASGRQVTLIDATRHPLGERIPGLAGARIRAELEAAGIRFRLGDRARVVKPLGVRRLSVHTASGERHDADLVVALGEPQARTGLAERAGIRAGAAGIVVDACLRTDAAGVHALGACACLPPPLRGASIEAQAEALARTLCGRPTEPVLRRSALRLNTPASAVALVDAPPNLAGEWHERASARGVEAGFLDRRGRLRGFVLVGECVDLQQAWTARLADC